MRFPKEISLSVLRKYKQEWIRIQCYDNSISFLILKVRTNDWHFTLYLDIDITNNPVKDTQKELVLIVFNQRFLEGNIDHRMRKNSKWNSFSVTKQKETKTEKLSWKGEAKISFLVSKIIDLHELTFKRSHIFSLLGE